jgi:DNA (cytosine-5)-methyltransferase 1
VKLKKLLDLFCKAGGCTKGYQQAGFYVVGVDIEPQPHYCGDEFIRADVLTLDIEFMKSFDAIHASPPCQRYSLMQHIHKNKDKHPDLIEPTRNLLLTTGKPFIIENVEGSPLLNPTRLCGTMFGLKISRHRLFETNFSMPLLNPPCDHREVYDCFHGGEEARGERGKLSKIMEINWFMTRNELRNAIPPAYTKFIGRIILKKMEEEL